MRTQYSLIVLLRLGIYRGAGDRPDEFSSGTTGTNSCGCILGRNVECNPAKARPKGSAIMAGKVVTTGRKLILLFITVGFGVNIAPAQPDEADATNVKFTTLVAF